MEDKKLQLLLQALGDKYSNQDIKLIKEKFHLSSWRNFKKYIEINFPDISGMIAEDPPPYEMLANSIIDSFK